MSSFKDQLKIGRLAETDIVRWLRSRGNSIITCGAPNTKETMIVIECDGHEFHERTKEQASRDRQRDRLMTAAGLTVLRFTGSEIYRDSKACMLEVENFLWNALFGTDCPMRQYDE